MAANTYFYTLGRRKDSTVTVRVYPEAGTSTFNGKPIAEVYGHQFQQVLINRVFEAAGLKPDQFYFTARAQGGGLTGQLDALRLALARALVEYDPTLKPQLKVQKLLTRDPRMVERKKAGLRKARRAEQFSKR